MADKKDFSDFQVYKCDILTPEDIEVPKFCPTCTKNPSYVEPTWYTTDETYLDEKNCLYKFNVTRIIEDLRLGEEENKLRSFAINLQNANTPEKNFKSYQVQSKIIRTGIYNMLVDLNKELTYRNICATTDCSPVRREKKISDEDLDTLERILDQLKYIKNLINENEEYSDIVEFVGVPLPVQVGQESMLDAISNFEYELDLEEGEEVPAELQLYLDRIDELLQGRDDILRMSEIDIAKFNPYGLENYAVIEKIHFPATESGGMILQFLVSVPAFAVDRIPNASTADDGDDESDQSEDFVLNARKIRRQLRTLAGGLYLYQQQYAVARYLDQTAMYFKDNPLKEFEIESIRREFKTSPGDGKIDFSASDQKIFFKLLKDALISNDYRVDNFQFGGFNQSLAQNIKFKVDQDSDKPYQIKKILVETRECKYKRIRGAKVRKLINYMNRKRYVSAYLSKIDVIYTELTSERTPEWYDFIPKYNYPEVVIQKAKDKDGLAGSSERLALECLFEDVGIDAFGSGQIRNYLLEQFISLPRLLAYLFNQRACFDTRDLKELNPTNVSFAKAFGNVYDDMVTKDLQNQMYDKEVDKILNETKPSDIKKTVLEVLLETNAQNEEGGPWLDDDGNDRSPTDIAFLITKDLQEKNKDYSQITLEDYSRSIAFYTNRDYGEVLTFLEEKAASGASAKLENLTKNPKNGKNNRITGFFDGEPGNFITGDSGHPLLIAAAEKAKLNMNYEDTLLKQILEMKRNSSFGDGKEGFSFDDILSYFGVCGFRNLISKVIECLLGGVSFQQFVYTFIQSQLENMDLQTFGLFLENLPAEEQAKVYSAVQAELGDIIEPWKNQDSYEQNVGQVTAGQPLVFKDDDENILSGIDRSDWDSLSFKEKQEAKEEFGKPRVDTDSPDFTGNYNQTSIGKSLNNIVGVFMKAYVKAIINQLDLDLLLDKIKDYPGAEILKKVLFQIACMTPPLMSPPIDGFLKSFTLEVCDPNIGITWPKLGNFKLANFWANLKFNIILGIIILLVVAIIKAIEAIIQKILELLDGLLCRALEAVGKFTGNYLSDAIAGTSNGMSFRTAMREAFCGPDTPQDKVDALSESLITGLGFAATNSAIAQAAQGSQQNADLNPTNFSPSSSPEATDAQTTMNVLSSLLTKEELLYFMAADPNDYDTTLLNMLARSISASSPALAQLLGTPDQLSNFFASISNFLSPDKKEAILQALGEPLPDGPLNDSLCLTNEEYDRWVDKRRKLYEDFGFDDADQIPTAQDEDVLEDLRDLLDAFNDPNRGVTNAVDNLMNEPVCDDDDSLILRDSPETREISNRFSNGVFDNLRMSIYRDLYGNDGYFNELLSDFEGKPLRRHNFKAFFKRNYVNAIDENYTNRDAKGYFPETVGSYMKEQIESQDFTFEVNNGDQLLSKGPEAGIKKKAEIFASAVNEDRDEFYENSKGNRKQLMRKRIKIQVPTKKINKPSIKLTFTDGAEERDDGGIFGSTWNNKSYKFDLTYSDRKRNTPAGEIWSESSLIISLGEDSAEGTIYRNQEFLPESIYEKYSATAGSANHARLAYFRAFMQDKISNGAPNAPSFTAEINETYKKINNLFLNELKFSVVNGPDGDLSNGFKFGYKADDIEPEDLVYVDPEPGSTEYTYENDEQVLGRSKTNNPRVIYLDPQIYGGRYTNPPFMIEPMDHSGWYGFALSLIPKHSFCNKKEVDLIGFPYIKDQVNFYYNNLPTEPRLQQEEECVVEPPFNKIANRQTKANLHGIVTAIIRMYLSNVYLNGFTMFANVSFRSTNYSSVLFDFVADLIENDLSDTPDRENAFIRNKIKRENYFLLFLEQAVESYQRLIDYKGIQPTPAAEEAMQIIREVQAFYKQADFSDIDKLRENQTFKLDVSGNEYSLITEKKYMKFFQHALAYQAWGEAIFRSENTIKLKYLHKTDRYIKYLRLVSKIFCVRLVKKQAMEILSELTKYEADKLFNDLDRKVKPKAPIHSIVPYMLQNPKIAVIPQHKYGLRKPLVELANNGEGDFGQVHDVVHDISISNQLQSVGVEEINQSGRFIIERYVRVKDKEEIPESVANRNEKLFGVVNMEKFQEYLGTLDQTKKISDYFGDLKFKYNIPIEVLVSKGYSIRELHRLGLPREEMVLTPEILQQTLEVDQTMVNFDLTEYEPFGIQGETGLSYGLRICYFPPSNLPVNQLSVPDEIAINSKAYKLKQVQGLPNSPFMIPLIEAEVQIVDQTLSDVNFFDGPNAFDLYCMFRELEENDDYKFLFETAVPVKNYMSLFALYSNLGFQASWGLSEDERNKPENEDEEDEDELDLDGDGEEFGFELYEKSRKKARKLFVNFYNQNDFFDDENASQDDIFNFMLNFSPFNFRLPFRLPWWIRRKQRRYRCEDN